MSFLDRLRNLVEEPPPAYAFEVGPEGIAHWQGGHVRFDAYPQIDHEQDAAALASAISQITPAANGNKRRAAALILPDRAVRVTLMDFDQFPRNYAEQQALIRFRLKRTVPFDIETAILRFHTKPKGGNKVELTVAAIAVETLAPMEAAFRMAGFHPGYVAVSGLSAANLAPPNSTTLRLCGLTLTLCHFEQKELRLFRCLELQNGTLDEVLNVVDPSLAYLEDERGVRPSRMDICGLGSMSDELKEHLQANWNVDTQPVRSPLGQVDSNNAGLYGYLDSMGVS